jgi:hypothetical protein
MTQIRVRSGRRILPAEMTRVPAAAARNINAVVDAQFNQAAGKIFNGGVCHVSENWTGRNIKER